MFAELPLWGNALVFVVCAAFVWLAGTRLAHYADTLAVRTGIGHEFLGLLLLGGVTSLPEAAVGTTAALGGYPELSVNNLLGSAAVNVLIIALADAVIGRDAITSTLASPGVLLQGVLGILLLGIVAAAATVGDTPVWGIGAWSWLLLSLYPAALWVIIKSEGRNAWTPKETRASVRRGLTGATATPQPGTVPQLLGRSAIAAAVILVCGVFLGNAGEAIAKQTGLGTSFVGALLFPFATSLPEVSTVLAAVRLRRYEMAIADVFGTNLFNVNILVLVDALYDGGPVLAEVGRFSAFGALLAMALTALFLAGMIERRDRTVFRMGLDSLAAIVVYVGGVTVLYHLR